LVRRWSHGAFRTLLIGYGVALFGFLFTRAGIHEPMGTAAEELLLGGIGLQLAVLAVRWWIRRRAGATGHADALRALDIVDLIADGVTVLLFALATFQGISRFVG
jgi:hypothetical protein